jgi:hypothetical protein
MSKLDWLRSLVEEVNQKHKSGTNAAKTMGDGSGLSLAKPSTSQVGLKQEGLKGILEPAKVYRHVIVDQAHHVPFHESYPTFDRMNERQLRWYLYWRQQVQKGLYPDTSEGYIFLYVFELLNFAFESNREKVVDMLVEVYDAYRDRVPRVAATLPSWIGDMLSEIGKPEEAKAWYEITTPSQYATDTFELYERSGTVPPFSLWKRLLPEPTAFYREHADAIESCMELVLPILDQLFREQRQQSLLQVLLPDKWVVEDARFYEWAVLERPVPTRRKVTYSPKYEGKRSTLDLLTACVRYIENHFRKDYAKRPVKIEESLLSRSLQTILDDAFRHYRLLYPKPERSLSRKSNRAHVKSTHTPQGAANQALELDLEQVQRLHQESEWVRGAIEALDEEQDEIPTQPERMENLPTLEDLLETRQADGTLQHLYERLNETEQAFCQWFQEAGRVERTLAETREFARQHGALLHTLLDSINEKALECLGDLLLEADEETVRWNTDI